MELFFRQDRTPDTHRPPYRSAVRGATPAVSSVPNPEVAREATQEEYDSPSIQPRAVFLDLTVFSNFE